jgi:hypothetical protein
MTTTQMIGAAMIMTPFVALAAVSAWLLGWRGTLATWLIATACVALIYYGKFLMAGVA